jgi:undecaprenyl diphosphate synthase
MNIVIRTGFVKRLSGFFPIETRYAELFFIDKFWPQFTPNDLYDIIKKYNLIDRRFGK